MKINTGLNQTTPQTKSKGPWVEIENCECIQETERAILVWFDIDVYPEWIPKSHVGDDSEIYKRGQKGKLVISEWIANQKGLTSEQTSKSKPAADSKLELVEPYKLYRQLVRKYHPDINREPWAGEVAKDLTSLWHEILKASGKR